MTEAIKKLITTKHYIDKGRPVGASDGSTFVPHYVPDDRLANAFEVVLEAAIYAVYQYEGGGHPQSNHWAANMRNALARANEIAGGSNESRPPVLYLANA